MVLGGEDHPGESASGSGPRPLAGVEGARAEDGGGGVAGAPLRVGEGVGAEVEEESHLAQLPPELRGGGQGRNGKRGRCRMGRTQTYTHIDKAEEGEEERGIAGMDRRHL